MINILAKKDPIRFNLKEISGSLGDLGLFIPLVVAMTISCDLDIGVVLIFAGLMNLLTGLIFRQPIPVQPMKALAIVVITEGMLKDELFAAGIMIGIILVCLSYFADSIYRWIPKCLVRAIQLGVGTKLLLKGISWMRQIPLVGWDGLLTAIMVILIFILLLKLKQPALFYIFLGGFILLYLKNPSVYKMIKFDYVEFSYHFPPLWAWKHGVLKGVLPQLPLTLLNSVLAVCALSASYFPGKGIPPRKMALSVGLMNLVCVPFGGIPMCHGSGGLAAQYRFGARSGGSVIILGIIKILVGFFLGSAIFGLLQEYPTAILGPMLIFAGFELAKMGVKMKDDFKWSHVIMLLSAVIIVTNNTFMGFLIGGVAYLIFLIINRSQSWQKI